MKKAITLIILLVVVIAGVCFAGSDLEVGGDIYLLDDNWIGLGSDKARISFDDVTAPTVDNILIWDADFGGIGLTSGYTPSIFSTKDAEFTKYILMHYFDSSDQAIIDYSAATFLLESDSNPLLRITTSSADTLLYGNLQVTGDIYANVRTGGTQGDLYAGESETLVVTLKDTGDAVFAGTITVTGDYAVAATTVSAWEIDGSDDLMPIAGSFNDPGYDLDSNDDLMPAQIIYFETDTSGNLMPNL